MDLEQTFWLLAAAHTLLKEWLVTYIFLLCLVLSFVHFLGFLMFWFQLLLTSSISGRVCERERAFGLLLLMYFVAFVSFSSHSLWCLMVLNCCCVLQITLLTDLSALLCWYVHTERHWILSTFLPQTCFF